MVIFKKEPRFANNNRETIKVANCDETNEKKHYFFEVIHGYFKLSLFIKRYRYFASDSL